MERRDFLKLLMLNAVALSGLQACAVNPVTGERQIMLLTEQDESRLGAETDKSVVEQYGLYEDGNLQSYLKTVGMPMAGLSHRPNLGWQFKVMDSPIVNAFAAPGGYIYVTRGLLAAVDNEAELAGVLGHEIGHVTARHSAEQYSRMMLANLGLGVGQGLLGSYGEALGPLMEAGTGLLFLKFSRDDEREADALGVEYASRAGYDAGRMADFFTTLHRMSNLDGNSGGRLPEFFSTHPNPVNREATVRQMAAEWQTKQPGREFRVNRESYLSRINGLVYGEDPRNGFREGDWYYFPDYRVQFRIPDSWQFEREGAQAQMVHPQQKGVVLFNIEKSRSIDEVANRFVSGTKARVIQSQLSTVQGMPSKELLSVLVQNGKKAAVLSRFYLRNGHVFAFHALCAEQDFTSLRTSLAQPAGSFRLIEDQQKQNRQPLRIRVETVRRARPMQQLLQENHVDQKLWNRVAWLNGLSLSDQVVQGRQIKLVK